MKRNRFFYSGWILITILLGLSTRKYADIYPGFIAEYCGDVLWAAMVYLIVCRLFPGIKPYQAGMAALLFSWGIEISQLYQGEWIHNIRATTLGGLILGHGFLWSDMMCYVAGILLVFLPDAWWKHKTIRESGQNGGKKSKKIPG